MIKNKITTAMGLTALLMGMSTSALAAKPTIPADGQRMFILGQDQTSIQEYMADESLPRPYGFTSYFTLSRGEPSFDDSYCFKGLDGLKNLDNYNSNSADGCFDNGVRRNQWGSDVQNAQWIIETYNPEVVALGLWCPQNHRMPSLYNDGAYDDLLTELADFFKEYSDTKFFLRTCYEFNGDAGGWSPENFRNTFKYIRTFLDNAGIDNVAHVWQSDSFHGTGRGTGAIGNQEAGYWPGKQYVDWVGSSQFDSDTGEEAQIAESEGLPHFIAEATPHGALFHQYDFQLPFGGTGQNGGVTLHNDLNWFNNKLGEITRTSTKAWHYINADWTAQPQWANAADQAGQNYFKYTDSRVQESPEVKAHFINMVTEENGFLLGGETTPKTAPVISDCGFSSNAIVQGNSVDYACDVNDVDEGVESVTLSVNGNDYPTQRNGEGTYRWTIAANDLIVGDNTVEVTAFDTAGTRGTQTDTLTVSEAPAEPCTGIDSPIASFSSTKTSDAEAEDGTVHLQFAGDSSDNRTKITFTLSDNNGKTYTKTVKDKSGSYTFTGVAASEYSVASSWKGGECPVDLGTVTVEAGSLPCGIDTPIATVKTVKHETQDGAADGSIKLLIQDDAVNGGTNAKMKISLDGGNSFVKTVKDSKGKYTAKNLADGSYDIAVAWKDGSCLNQIETVTVNAGEPVVTGPVTYQAESGDLSGTAVTYSDDILPGVSGVAFINTDGAGVAFTSENAGTKVTLRYASEQSGNSTIRVNGQNHNVTTNATGAWTGAYQDVSIDVAIEKGDTVEFIWVNGNSAINLDYLVIE